jgi:two-component system OmpR family sensor kinase
MLDGIQSALQDRTKTLDQMRRFVADASHELRTPLVSVRGYAELYRMGALKKKADVAEAMQRIESEAVRMTGLVESLLTLTRMDEQGNLKLATHDLAELCELTLKDARVASPQLVFAFSGQSSVSASFDSDRIKQVLTNLLANAARFAPNGSVVTVRLSATEQYAQVSVIDRGEGIPESLRKQVFERFYRADNSRNRETGGSGLGLAIAQSIVTAHGGKIWAEETPGGGATFTFEIPLTQPTE